MQKIIKLAKQTILQEGAGFSTFLGYTYIPKGTYNCPQDTITQITIQKQLRNLNNIFVVLYKRNYLGGCVKYIDLKMPWGLKWLKKWQISEQLYSI